MITIISTLSRPKAFAYWTEAEGSTKRIERIIHINGGANVANKRTLETPEFAKTRISEKDFNFLMEKCPDFKRQYERGYLKKDNAKTPNADGLEKKDGSAQKTEKDFQNDPNAAKPYKGEKK